MLWLSNLLQCCNKSGSTELKVFTIGGDYDGACCKRTWEQDPKVIQISSDVMDGHSPSQPVHALTSPDAYISGGECSVPPIGPLDAVVDRFPADGGSCLPALTPRQQTLKERVRLPPMLRYPVPQDCSEDDPEEVRSDHLLRIFQDFVLDMHKGVYMTQVNAHDEYADIHCQLQDDLQILKVDQGSGCLVEFPLTAVTRIYRLVRNEGKDFSTGSSMGPTPLPPLPLHSAEHIVVVEFMRRKLVLVFAAMPEAQSFIMCLELLVRFTQEVVLPSEEVGSSVSPRRENSNQAPYVPWPKVSKLGGEVTRAGDLSARNKSTSQQSPPVTGPPTRI